MSHLNFITPPYPQHNANYRLEYLIGVIRTGMYIGVYYFTGRYDRRLYIFVSTIKFGLQASSHQHYRYEVTHQYKMNL